MDLKLYNTESKKIEKFEPLNAPLVTLYTCGPTVYYHTHIGHIRAYTNSDILKRTLEYAGYTVRHVMNITDVGHMTSDEDEGDDKLEVGARRENKTVWEIARFYEAKFFEATDAANIKRPTIVSRATEHISKTMASHTKHLLDSPSILRNSRNMPILPDLIWKDNGLEQVER